MPDQDHPRKKPSALAAAGSAEGAADLTTPAAPGESIPEIPDSELPPVSFPNSEQYQFRLLAEARRKVRIRNEVIFGVILLVAGLVFLAAAHNAAFVVLALISAGAMVAYEMTVATLE